MSLYQTDVDENVSPVLGVFASLAAARSDASELVGMWPGPAVLAEAEDDGYLELHHGPRILRLERLEIDTGGQYEVPPSTPTAAIPP